MAKAANRSEMQKLHKQLTQTLNAMLSGAVDEQGKPVTDDDGKPIVSASVLNVARQFLSDNDIEADVTEKPEEGNPQLHALKEKASVLPFPEADSGE